MWADDRHMSTSLTTIVLEPEPSARAYLHRTERPPRRHSHAEGRRTGTARILDSLAAFLVQQLTKGLHPMTLVTAQMSVSLDGFYAGPKLTT